VGHTFSVAVHARGPHTQARLLSFSSTLQELLLLRKYGKQQAGIDLLKLNQGESKKKKKKEKADAEEEEEETAAYGLQSKKGKGADDEDE
jgi:hypothetical protein